MTKKPPLPKHGIVYVIRCKTAGMVYVGKTINDLKSRWKCHVSDSRRGSTSKLHVAMRIYGEADFECMQVASGIFGGSILDLEAILIRQYNSESHGYNGTWPERWAMQSIAMKEGNRLLREAIK